MGDKGLVQRTFTLFSSVFEEIICSLIRFHYEISPLELDTSLRYNLFDHFFLLLRSESGVETILCELGLLFGNKIESFPRHYHLRNRCITRLLLFGREMHVWLMGFQKTRKSGFSVGDVFYFISWFGSVSRLAR